MTPEQLIALADQCVKCGLCLPHCPTYGRLRDESDSPRGRIALIQGWAIGTLRPSRAWAAHLDRCLGCRACEAACPSLVAYGRLADGAKAARTAALPAWRRLARRAWLSALSDARIAVRLAWAAGVYRRLGVARLVEGTGLARRGPFRPYLRLAATVPDSAVSVAHRTPAHPDLELFVGCTGGLAQGRALNAAVGLCTVLGLEARVAAEARCCGAMLRHNGFPVEAESRRRRCTPADGDPPLVGLSSACIAELREGRDRDGHPIAVAELCDYLVSAAPLARLPLKPAGRRILVHEPCSHRNLLGGNAAVYRLLGLIPETEVRPSPGGSDCCGAAGTYMLTQPEMAEALVEDRIAAIRDLAPAILVTTNPGCALHLQAGLRERGLDIQVRHPVEVLWDCVRGGGHRPAPGPGS